MKRAFFLFLWTGLFFQAPLTLKALDAPEAGTSYSYPLPVSGDFVKVAYTLSEPGTARVLVYNEAGALVMNSTEVKPPGLQTTQLCVCSAPPGLYIYFVLLNYDSGKKEKLRPGKIVVIH